jgi:hypothetical protein
MQQIVVASYLVAQIESLGACFVTLTLERVSEELLLLEPFALPMIASICVHFGSLNEPSHLFDLFPLVLWFFVSALCSGCLWAVVWVAHC